VELTGESPREHLARDRGRVVARHFHVDGRFYPVRRSNPIGTTYDVDPDRYQERVGEYKEAAEETETDWSCPTATCTSAR